MPALVTIVIITINVMKPYIVRILKTKLGDFLNEPSTRQKRNAIFKKVLEANYKKDAPLCFIEETLRRLLKERGLSKSAINATALQRIEEINTVDELCELLKDVIVSKAREFESSSRMSDEVSDAELVVIIDDYKTIQESLTQWADDEYAPVDERIESSRHKKIRRFDSLARILSSQETSISVCSAVTIDTTQVTTPKLIVGANLSHASAGADYLREIRHKLDILKRFYTDFAYGFKELPDETHCEDLSHTLYKKLFPSHTTYRERMDEANVLEQAVYKLTHALLYDDITFTDAEKGAFLVSSASIVLLPTVDNHAVQQQINYFTPRGLIQVNNRLKHDLEGHELKYVHAEQLIATYLYDDRGIPKGTRFIFGISKLCCATCSDFMKAYPGIEVRGHHQKHYQGVINLATGMRSPTSSQRTGPTGPKKSPFKTPQKSPDTDGADERQSALERDTVDSERPIVRLGLHAVGMFSGGLPKPKRITFTGLGITSESDEEEEDDELEGLPKRLFD